MGTPARIREAIRIVAELTDTYGYASDGIACPTAYVSAGLPEFGQEGLSPGMPRAISVNGGNFPRARTHSRARLYSNAPSCD